MWRSLCLRFSVPGPGSHIRTLLPGPASSTFERLLTTLLTCFRLLVSVSLRNHFPLRKAITGCNMTPAPPSPPAPLFLPYIHFISPDTQLTLPPSLLLSSPPLLLFLLRKETERRRRSAAFLLLPFSCLYLLTCSFPPPSHVSWAASS